MWQKISYLLKKVAFRIQVLSLVSKQPESVSEHNHRDLMFLVLSLVFRQPESVSGHNLQRAPVLQDVWTANERNFQKASCSA